MKRGLALLIALGLTLMVAAPVWANDLHQTPPIASTSTAFPPGANDCTGVQPGTVLWHFVHTMAKSSDLPSTLTLSFQNKGSVTATGFVNGNSEVMYNYTTGPDTLLSASDTIVNDGHLNLSHICNGGPPPDVPEAPASVLLVITAGIAGLGFLAWRMRRARSAA